MVGKNGLTNAVLTGIDVSLTSHELIKILIRGGNKNECYNLCLKIQQKLKAELVHQIGFIKVFYRSKPGKYFISLKIITKFYFLYSLDLVKY